MQRLSPLDASFLYLEGSGLPMHVAGLTILGPRGGGRGRVTIEELRQLIAARLDQLPSFRYRLRESMPLQLARPVWEVMKHVDLRHQVRHFVLPRPGSDAQLLAFCDKVHSRPLDRRYPLWEEYLIDGLTGGRQALLLKMHHALTDGMAAMELTGVLFDPLPGSHRPHGAVTGYHSHDSGIRGALGSGLGLARLIASGPFVRPGPFGRPRHARRTVALATLSLASMRSVQERFGGSLADLLLALVGVAIGRYLAKHPSDWSGSSLRVMLPVSTRPPGAPVTPGTEVTAVFVDVPIDTSSLADCTRRIAASKSELRTYREAGGVGMLVHLAGLLPAPLHAATVRIAGSLPVAHLVVSDIPGPTERLGLRGAPVIACYPLMPVAPFAGGSIAAVSMSGTMGVGLTFDPTVVDNPDQIAVDIEQALNRAVRGIRRPAARRVA